MSRIPPRTSSVLFYYYYYHSLISKRVCVVDSLSGAFDVSWLTWIYQRRDVIVVMMLAAEQPSLAGVKGNTCLGRKNIEASWFLSQVHRFPFWALIPQDTKLSSRPSKTITLNNVFQHFSGAGQKSQLHHSRTPAKHWKKAGSTLCFHNSQELLSFPGLPPSQQLTQQALSPQMKRESKLGDAEVKRDT